MTTLSHRGRSYDLDEAGFLLDPDGWDEDFPEALAPEHGIPDGLSVEHWRVLRSIRAHYHRTGRCPLVYQTCRANDLKLRDLHRLFPTGYLRGACRLAGLTYAMGYHCPVPTAPEAPAAAPPGVARKARAGAARTYTVDICGFLIDADEWDEGYAIHRAFDLKMPPLRERHWRVIHFLRDSFRRTGRVPTVYETCVGNGLEMDELEELFPDGYQRGAVRLAGLRAI